MSICIQSLQGVYAFSACHVFASQHIFRTCAFFHRNSDARRKEEELDVEGPPLNVERRKEPPCGPTGEKLEPALCVVDAVDAADVLDEEVEPVHEDVAVPKEDVCVGPCGKGGGGGGGKVCVGGGEGGGIVRDV